ncbi:prepilin-type N-terminal cleavage/methylation domain-containing protein [Deinococcus sp. KSM4-11]|uniref:pilus assembly FimT family protein n=1 Tax=Deinococcus sp. KSM4-11 TaxID=2568654 RepID=UPI0010A400BA|nr:prepilin-type N-terminal cleavage/methylation domain-containing protein [Deinococcus sp. KSM4-11]THF88026.1 prepilin-type N-terminal cleavage/methylation domain-containing protein [Deinococcus sp. KSM4-11]
MQGFTLIEVLVVLAILSILLALALFNYAKWRASSAVRQGAQEFTRAITETRSGSKRLNVCQEVKLAASTGATSVTVNTFSGTVCTGTAASTASFPMPTNVTVSLAGGSANSIIFKPPYGTTSAADKTFTVQWASDSSIVRSVRVTGLFGKVIVQ